LTLPQHLVWVELESGPLCTCPNLGSPEAAYDYLQVNYLRKQLYAFLGRAFINSLMTRGQKGAK
jgi:hypothetical protein